VSSRTVFRLFLCDLLCIRQMAVRIRLGLVFQCSVASIAVT
jgi:hypothetical protein